MRNWYSLYKQSESNRIISFDFDDTLTKPEYSEEDGIWMSKEPNEKIISEMRRLYEEGYKIIIVTSRHDDAMNEVISFVYKHNLPVAHIYNTNGEPKAPLLKELNVVKHFDDSPHEIEVAEEYNVNMERIMHPLDEELESKSEVVSKVAEILNTSNPGKYEEFKQFFGDELEDRTSLDLSEVDGTPEEVAIYKSRDAGDGVIIEDTSLEIDGYDVGVNIKLMLQHLDEMIGRRAVWTVFLAVKREDYIYLYNGSVTGRIGPKSGKGFGFDPYFYPLGGSTSLGNYKPEKFNARYLAVQNFKQNKPYKIVPVPKEDWKGKWQND